MIETYLRLHKPSGTVYEVQFNGTHHPYFLGHEVVSRTELNRVKKELVSQWNKLVPDTWEYALPQQLEKVN